MMWGGAGSGLGGSGVVFGWELGLELVGWVVVVWGCGGISCGCSLHGALLAASDLGDMQVQMDKLFDSLIPSVV